jgi:Secretion system C-terminal sorting domain
MLLLKKILLVLCILASFAVFGANRYWVSPVAGNWNNPMNWSATSGGIPGASVPTLTDYVYFNGLGIGNCNIDISVGIDGINTSGYSGTINLGLNPFNPASSGTVACVFAGGTLTGTVGNSLSFSTNSTVTFGATAVGLPVNITAGAINFNGAIFNQTVTISSIGTVASTGTGGNVFNAALTITATGANFFTMGSSSPDIFNGVLTLRNQGTSRIRMSYTSIGNQFNHNIFVGSNAGNGVSFGENNGLSTLAATRTVGIDPINFTSGELRFANFTQVGTTAQNLILSGAALLYNLNSQWNGNVNFRAPSMRTEGTTYQGTAYLEKSGPSGDNSLGNNIFNGNCTIRNTGAGVFSMGNVNPDFFNFNLITENTGSNFIYLAASSLGNVIGGNLTANLFNTGTPGNSGFYICGASGSSLNIIGNATLVANASASTANLHFCYNGSLTLGGNLLINNTSSSNNLTVNLAYLPTSAMTINGTTTVNHQGSGTNSRIVLGFLGDCTFNGDITINANSTATNGEVRFNHAITSGNIFNGDIILNNTGASSDGVRLGETGGQGTMSAGNQIYVGPVGYTSSVLDIRNFTQLGNTPQNLSCVSPLTYIWMQNCVWNGPFTTAGEPTYVNGCTFHNTSFFNKQGGFLCTNNGGNTFNGPTTIMNSSASDFTLDDIVPNDYNDDVTFINTGTSVLYPSNQCASTYAGDITISSNYAMTLANTGASKIIMDGTVPQSINTTVGTPKPNFNALQTLNPVSEITLNAAINLKKTLELTQGNIITTTINSLAIDPAAAVTDVDDDAYVSGPCLRAGTAPFTFPIGKNGVYRPVTIGTSPVMQVFSAEYFGNDVLADGIPDTPVAAGIDHISDCEYWMVNRVFGSTAVDLTLTYKDWGVNNCSGVVNPSALRVVKWNGSSWLDLGNGGFGGSGSNGWILSGAPINSFSPFTIGTLDPANPLPIELISFDALVEGENVRLNWATANEINNEFFEIERSSDGIHFETILYQNGAGNSTTLIEYTDLDRNPLFGISYYRLKQVDVDGDSSYSDIISVNFDKLIHKDIIVYPNPSKDFMGVHGSEEELESIRIFNLMGQDLTSNVSIQVENAKTLTLDLKNLPSGLYLLQTKNQAVRFTKL